MRRRWRKHRHTEVAEMNITAFMNLMVVLVPFLLISAVFSRLAILELVLPDTVANSASQPVDNRLRLEVIVREDRIEVANRGQQPLVIKRSETGQDLTSLSDVLKEIKRRFPETSDATLLLEPEISYELLVQVMDTMRVARLVQLGGVAQVDLFPDVAIGDAPPAFGP